MSFNWTVPAGYHWPRVAAVFVLHGGYFGVKLPSNIYKNFTKCRQNVTIPAF